MGWEIASTITTMLALLFVLLHDFVWAYWTRAVLVLRYSNEDSSRSQIFSLPNRQEVWQLALVANQGRRDSAEDVEVVLQEVVPLSATDLTPAGPASVKNYALKWSLLPSWKLRIGAGVQRWVDLVYALELPADGSATPVRRLVIPVKDTPWLPEQGKIDPTAWHTEGHVLPPGAHRFVLALSALSLPATRYIIDVQLRESADEPDLRRALEVLRVSSAE